MITKTSLHTLIDPMQCTCSGLDSHSKITSNTLW